ncbi:MAG: hypothetical protein AB7S80_05765 [Rhizobiaceae bacterium]
MDRKWYREKIIDKLILGALSSMLAVAILFSVEHAENRLSFIRDNSQSKLEFSQSLYDSYVKALFAAADSLEKFVIDGSSKPALQNAILGGRSAIRLAIAFFEKDEPRTDQAKLLVERMGKCRAVHVNDLNIGKLADLQEGQKRAIADRLADCILASALAYASYREEVVRLAFDTPPKWGDMFARDVYARPDYQLFLGIGVVLLLLVAGLYLVARRDGAADKAGTAVKN